MTETEILLNTVGKVKEFVFRIVEYPCDCDIQSGTYVIDAKSIMGIFSLNLSKPVRLIIHEDNADLSRISEFIVS